MNKIKYFREKAKLTQEEVARKLDITLRHLQKLEKGECAPSVYKAMRISLVLNADIYDLFPLEDNY